jgi:hypothetical protein
LRLEPGCPNPAPAGTTLRFHLAQTEPVDLSVFAIDGRRVATLWSGPRGAGGHEVAWRGTDDLGSALPSGVYLVRLRSAREERTVKVVLE